MDRRPFDEEIAVVGEDPAIVVHGQRGGLHVAVGVRHEQEIVAVVDVGGVLLHVVREEEDLPIHAALVGEPRGDLGNEDEAVLLVLFPFEEVEKLPQLGVLIEGAQIVTRIGDAAPRESRGERGHEREKCQSA